MGDDTLQLEIPSGENFGEAWISAGARLNGGGGGSLAG